jgi:hypothetical protein
MWSFKQYFVIPLNKMTFLIKSLLFVSFIISSLNASVFDLKPAKNEIQRILNVIPNSFVSTNVDDFPEVLELSTSSNDSSIKSYIRAESLLYGFSEEKDIRVLQKAIWFIANNDFSGFHCNLRLFKDMLGICPLSLERNGVRGYFAHYYIRFGATRFVDSNHPIICSKHVELEFGEAFVFLAESKPIETVLRVLRYVYDKNQQDLKNLVISIQNIHPDLHFLDYLAFEFRPINIKILTLAREILFDATEEEAKLNVLTRILDILVKDPPGAELEFVRLIEIPKRYPRYYMELSEEVRFFLVQLSVCIGDLDVFEMLIEMDPEFLLRVSTRPIYFTLSSSNLFHFAVYYNQDHFVPFFMETIPELATAKVNGSTSAFDFALSLDRVRIVESMDPYQFTYAHRIIEFIFSMNAFQYSFMNRNPETFSYYLTKMTRNEAVDNLYNVFGGFEAILKHGLKRHDTHKFRIARILVDQLGIDLINHRYYNGRISGGAVIFVDPKHVSEFECEFGRSSVPLLHLHK